MVFTELLYLKRLPVPLFTVKYFSSISVVMDDNRIFL